MVLARMGGNHSWDDPASAFTCIKEDTVANDDIASSSSSQHENNARNNHLFPRQRVLLQRCTRANSKRFNDGSRRSFMGDATSFRRSDSERSVGSIGSSMRSVKSQNSHAFPIRPKVKKNLVQKVRTSARYLLKKKTAKFASRLEHIRYIETIDEYTENHIETLWFAAADLDESKRDAEDLASLWEEQPAIAAKSAHENPFRGLEDKTATGHWEAYKARRDVLNAVLDVQDEQHAAVLKSADPQQLANASLELTTICVAPALERASQDAKDAHTHCLKIRQAWTALVERRAARKKVPKEQQQRHNHCKLSNIHASSQEMLRVTTKQQPTLRGVPMNDSSWANNNSNESGNPPRLPPPRSVDTPNSSPRKQFAGCPTIDFSNVNNTDCMMATTPLESPNPSPPSPPLLSESRSPDEEKTHHNTKTTRATNKADITCDSSLLSQSPTASKASRKSMSRRTNVTTDDNSVSSTLSNRSSKKKNKKRLGNISVASPQKPPVDSENNVLLPAYLLPKRSKEACSEDCDSSESSSTSNRSCYSYSSENSTSSGHSSPSLRSTKTDKSKNEKSSSSNTLLGNQSTNSTPPPTPRGTPKHRRTSLIAERASKFELRKKTETASPPSRRASVYGVINNGKSTPAKQSQKGPRSSTTIATTKKSGCSQTPHWDTESSTSGSTDGLPKEREAKAKHKNRESKSKKKSSKDGHKSKSSSNKSENAKV